MEPAAQEKAAAFLADTRFHQTLWIAPQRRRDSGASTPFRVAYSDLGDRDGAPVLVCGGLFGTRYTLALADELAKTRKIRLITPDKPGIGGTEAVELDQKINIWLDIVEALVQQLALGPISLIGHSSGVIYVLNTVLHLSHLLEPQHRYVALVTPWVYPSHGHPFDATVASLLPSWAINQYYNASYWATRLGISAALGPSTARPGVEMKDTDDATRAMDEKVLEYALNENVEGVSQEGLFCMRRGPKDLWGLWQDYDDYIPLLQENEAKHGPDDVLTVDVYFAESDNTSGNRGSAWFNECWKKHAAHFVHYQSTTAPGTTHETVMRPEDNVLDSIFSMIVRA